MLGVKQTKLLELEDAGILRSFLDGASRRISAASIYGRLRALAVASHPLNAEPAKVRRPKHMRRRWVFDRLSHERAERMCHDACSSAAADERQRPGQSIRRPKPTKPCVAPRKPQGSRAVTCVRSKMLLAGNHK